MYKIKKSSALTAFCYAVFIFFNVVYYSNITVNWEFYVNNNWSDNYFTYVLNGDSTKAYFPRLAQLINNDPTVSGFLSIQPSHSISYIYYFIWLVFRYDFSDIIIVSFLVNNILVVISYFYFVKLGKEVIGLKMNWRGLYFLNPTLVFISQMISKEMFLLTFMMMFAYYSIQRKYLFLSVISIFTYFVRAPFAVLGFMPLVLKGNEVRIKTFLFLILGFLLAVGYVYNSIGSFEPRIWKNAGMTRLAFEWNYFYLGPLMMMPFKILANFYDLIKHAFYPIQQGKIVLYHITTLPITLALFTQYKAIFYVVFHPLNALRGRCGSLLAFVIAFLILISANPYVHSRYLWPILPLILLVLIGIQKTRSVEVFSEDK